MEIEEIEQIEPNEEVSVKIEEEDDGFHIDNSNQPWNSTLTESETENYSCQVCNIRFDQKYELHDHFNTKSHIEEVKLISKCRKCWDRFKVKDYPNFFRIF